MTERFTWYSFIAIHLPNYDHSLVGSLWWITFVLPHLCLIYLQLEKSLVCQILVQYKYVAHNKEPQL